MVVVNREIEWMRILWPKEWSTNLETDNIFWGLSHHVNL